MDNVPKRYGFVEGVVLEDDIRTLAVIATLETPRRFHKGPTLYRSGDRVENTATTFDQWLKQGIEPQSADVSVSAYEYAQRFAENGGAFFGIAQDPLGKVKDTGPFVTVVPDENDRVTSFFVENSTALAILQRTNKLARLLVDNYPNFLPERTFVTSALCQAIGIETPEPAWPEIRVSHEAYKEMKRDAFRINDFMKAYGSDFDKISQQFSEPLMNVDAEPISAETFIRYAKKIMNAEPEVRELLHGAFERIEMRAANMGHNPFTYTYVKGRCYTASDISRLENHGNSSAIAALYNSIFMSHVAEGDRAIASAQMAVLAAWDLMMQEYPDFPEDKQKLLIADAYQRAEVQIVSHFGGERVSGNLFPPYELEGGDIDYTHVEAMQILSELRPDLYQPVAVPKKPMPGLELS